MKAKILIVIGIVVVMIIVLILFLVFNSSKKKIVINDITNFHLSYTQGYAINAYITYDLKKERDKTIIKVKPYGVEEEDTKEIEVLNSFVEKLEKILNKYKVGSWNGFNKNNKYVLDGDSFTLSILMDDKSSINASGYMMWPNNYTEVKSEIDSLFMKEYERSQ